ncbi:PAS domain S-box protein [Rhodoferax sp.]|uniref:PAS domain S-box protein n=1 Tax=Rhodoferax sp. TaxID=50421 RepID=UPI00283D7C6F|nr:PAS domain S-box protein [Rhodoferax sp.]MDR3369557.1 PAS domain S-box protein [Rhodoferax sp.]
MLTDLFTQLLVQLSHDENVAPGQSHALTTSPARFQALFGQVAQMVWLKDTQGRYLACNPPFEAFTGLSAAQLRGMSDDELYDAAQAQHCRKIDQCCLSTASPLVDECWASVAGGSRPVLLEITNVALCGSDGQPNGVLGMARDTTARWYLSQFEQLRSRILELLAQGVDLSHLLQVLADGLRMLQPEQSCLVALVMRDPERRPVLRVAASSGLSAEFTRAMDGRPVDLGHGACAMAAATGRRVVVENLAAPRTLGRTMTPRNRQGACWAQPFQDACGRTLGVLSVYVPTAAQPEPTDINLLEQLARLAGLAVERHQVAEQLRANEASFRALAEHTPEAVLVHREGAIVYINPATLRLFGAQSPEQLLGTSIKDRIASTHLPQQQEREQTIQTAQPIEPLTESCFVRLDGSKVEVEMQSTAMVYGAEPAIHVSIRDISGRKLAQEQLRVAASVFSHALEGIMITRPDGCIMDVNAAFTRITGYSREDVLGHTPSMLNSGRNTPVFYQQMWQSLVQNGGWSGELWNRRKDGEIYAQMLHISAVRDQHGQVMQYVALFSDITERKAHEKRLDQLAHYDALTGLPNRALHVDRLQHAMAQAIRRKQKLGVAFIDLDGFKAINDTYGHQAGDHLLITLAQRMRLALRESDTLSRLGGDEFAAVIVDLDRESDCDALLQRLLQAANQPVMFGDAILQVSASVGITFFPQAKELSPDQLLRQADLAMYRAKQSGKNRFQTSGFADAPF